ncbi:biotin--[acetyl-CoA-carboxylase] ligase [Paenibacillus albicereus]|uniref:Bifunctional ligase/repressor BirA n=1 Tax=Paenibacillus albicereus TaxID=2726185 RepID=A0A6H2GX16_9BACL|nr:biotin--[acetyl-CoA-carboxylase] ligase [Paenibacillus albicereus]QJC51899.1 biotin--[acetyl-CoA-carboxylase] ligase [Paenibacillus albicereus]
MDLDRLLELFEESAGRFRSGEEVSRELGVSRTAVWKGIRRLQEQGVEFEASRKLGYRLVGRPEALDAESIGALLRTESFGRRLVVLDKVDSTQNVAQQLALQGAEEGTLVIAEQQLSGRGRMGRGWVSPYGKGLWMSLVLRPQLPVGSAPQLTLLTAVALCRALRGETGLDIGIKWPNDLLVGGRKLSGILLESAAEDERLRHVVAGIGISVNLSEADYPPELLDKAVSLRMAAGRMFSRGELAAAFLLEWERLYRLYVEEGFGPVRLLWEALSVSLHREMSLRTPQGELVATPLGLHESGALLVRLPDGTERTLFSAEMGEPVGT